MIESLSPATAEYRFFGPIREVTKSMLVRYCHIDYDREIALAAIREPKGKKKKMMLGVARLTIETANVEEGEFAIVVRDAYQRKGIGSKLMDALIQAARDRHVREIRGHVLAANPGMTRFAEDLGFDVRPGDEPEVAAGGSAWVPAALPRPPSAGRRRSASVSVPSPRRPGSMPAGRGGYDAAAAAGRPYVKSTARSSTARPGGEVERDHHALAAAARRSRTTSARWSRPAAWCRGRRARARPRSRSGCRRWCAPAG